MKTLITIAKKAFKPVAVIKYLFFPFMMAQSQGTVDFSKIVKSETIVAQVETQTSVWIGTNNGLYQINKSNGKFVHLTTNNSVLPSNHITGICVTKDENIYASTDNGIFRFDGFSYLLISTENANLPTDNFTSITCDENDRIFIGTKSHGIVLMKNYKCQTFNQSNSVLTSNSVKKVYRDENGIIISELGNGNFVAMGSSNMILINTNEPYDLNVIAKR